MSAHLQEQWARLAHRGGVHLIILPNDPDAAHAALRDHYETHVAPREGAAWIRDPWTRKAMHELTSKHGFSFHDQPGIAPHSGYMVSTMPEHEEAHPMSALAKNPAIVKKYHAAHADVLKDPSHYMGAWEDHGRAYFDVSRHTHNEDEARQLATAHNQDAYYDLNKKKSVYVRASRAAVASTDSGHLTLYHGTTASNVDAIKRDGLRPPSSVMSSQWPMLTTSKEQAARYTSGRENPVVMEFHVPHHKVWHSGNTKAELWPGDSHNVYGHEATAYAVKDRLSPEHLKAVHPVHRAEGALL